MAPVDQGFGALTKSPRRPWSFDVSRLVTGVNCEPDSSPFGVDLAMGFFVRGIVALATGIVVYVIARRSPSAPLYGGVVNVSSYVWNVPFAVGYLTSSL